MIIIVTKDDKKGGMMVTKEGGRAVTRKEGMTVTRKEVTVTRKEVTRKVAAMMRNSVFACNRSWIPNHSHHHYHYYHHHYHNPSIN